MRSTCAPKACITGKACITHEVRISFVIRNASLKKPNLPDRQIRFFVGAGGGTRYGATRLHAHVSENSSPNCFLPLRSFLFESRPNNKNRAKPKGLPRFLLVPVAGLEPARCRHQRILSPSRLPIPSHRRIKFL